MIFEVSVIILYVMILTLLLIYILQKEHILPSYQS